MRHFSTSVEIPASPDRVWAVLSDIERWPEWTPTVRRIQRLQQGPLAVGSQARMRQPRLPPAVWEVTQLVEGSHFTWVTRSPGVSVTAWHGVEPSGPGTRATLSLQFSGVLGGLVARLTRGLNQRYLALEAKGLSERSSQDVTLEVATAGSAPVLANLLELYLHDLSEIFPMEVGADGRFGYDKLPLYWSEPDRHFAFLIRSRGRVAGFALVTRGSPATDDPEDLDVAEFFVLRAHRRSGVGRRAAFLLWDHLPGRWIVRVSEVNRGGLPFWETIVDEYARGAFSKREHPGKLHLFHVFSFKNDTRSGAVSP